MSEQHAIATILDAIDDALALSERAIGAAETLQQALLHELLTRGVPGWHTRWKSAPGIGQLPACWPVTTLGELCAPPEYGASAPALAFDHSLPRYVRITDIGADGRLISANPRSADPSLVRGYELRDGDLLFARSGTVGKTYLHSGQHDPSVFAGYLIRFRASQGLVLPEFLFAWTRTDIYRRWVESVAHAGAQPNINAAEYSALPIAYPPMREQEQIVELMRAAQVRHAADKCALDTLRQLKSTVSGALLTGKIRVPGSPLPASDLSS